MLCKDVMKTAVARCRESDRVERAARLMDDERIGFLPVVDGFDRVLGVVTDRDLAIRVLGHSLGPETRVSEVMSRPPFAACSEDDDLKKAEARMAISRTSRVMVLDHAGRCVGIISLSDIARADAGAPAGNLLRDVTNREAVNIAVSST